MAKPRARTSFYLNEDQYAGRRIGTQRNDVNFASSATPVSLDNVVSRAFEKGTRGVFAEDTEPDTRTGKSRRRRGSG
jgi:hypothetical protein